MGESIHAWVMMCPGMARVSGGRNRDERCRTMKGKVGRVLKELVTPKKRLNGPSKKACSETGVPKSGEPKQLDQTQVLVKHAEFHELNEAQLGSAVKRKRETVQCPSL